MKKILSTIAVLALFTNAFAVDLSIAQDQNQSQKIDKSNSMNKTLNNTESTSKDKSHSRTSDQSNSEARGTSRLEQTDSLIALAALEQSDIEPFASCMILTDPKLITDFGINADMTEDEDNQTALGVNSNVLDFVAEKTKAGSNIKAVIDKKNRIKLMEYMSCQALYGGLIAQQLKTGKFSVSLTDKEILKTFRKMDDNLDPDKCRFDASQNMNSIFCGETHVKIGYAPSLMYRNVSLFSQDKFYGYSAQKTTDNSKRYSDSKSLSESKKRSEANDLSKSITMNQSMSQDVSSKASSNLSLGKFIPGE